MPFLALLKLIPVKDWVYGALIAVLLAAFGWYTYHERQIGRQTIELADKKLADAQAAKNKETEDGISKGIQTALDKWKQDHPIPPPAPIPHLVCHNSPSGAVVPQGRGSANTGNGIGTAVPISPESTDAGFDPAQAVSSTGTEADTEIIRLKAKVTLLQDTIKAYQSGGLVKGN